LLEALGVQPDEVRIVGWSRFDDFVELSDAVAVAVVHLDFAALRAVPPPLA